MNIRMKTVERILFQELKGDTVTKLKVGAIAEVIFFKFSPLIFLCF